MRDDCQFCKGVIHGGDDMVGKLASPYDSFHHWWHLRCYEEEVMSRSPTHGEMLQVEEFRLAHAAFANPKVSQRIHELEELIRVAILYDKMPLDWMEKARHLYRERP